MSMKWCIQAGRFHDDGTIAEPLDRAALVAILERYADRDTEGVPIPGRARPHFPAWEALGFVEGEAILLRTTGVAEVNLIGSGSRLNGFLAALCRELGCRLLDANNGAWVTDHFLTLAAKSGAKT